YARCLITNRVAQAVMVSGKPCGHNPMTEPCSRRSVSNRSRWARLFIVTILVRRHDESRTMRAIVVEQPGPPEVLQLRDIPCPVARPGWVLVRVKAFGLNRSE